jgi:hypothetical protein
MEELTSQFGTRQQVEGSIRLVYEHTVRAC